MITDIFTTIQSIGTQFVTWLGSLIQSIAALIYVPAVGETPGSFTFLGTLMLIGLVAGMVWLVFRFVRSFVKIGGR